MRDFTRRILLAATLAGALPAFVAAAGNDGGGEWLTDLDAALAEAERSERLILVDLYADWCGWCKVLDERVFASAEFKEYARDFVLLRVDTEDGGEGTRLTERFRITSLPTTLLIDHRQARVGQIPGFAPVEQFLPKIDRELAAWEEFERGYREFGKSPDPQVLLMIAETLYERADDRAAEVYQRLLDTDSTTPEEAVWYRYRKMDALRLGGRFELAADELAKLRGEVAGRSDPDLAERLELLAAELAREQGDCAAAVVALESFLSEHPGSQHEAVAAQTLRTLRSRGEECT